MWLDNFDSGYAEGNHENVVNKPNMKWNSAYFFHNFFLQNLRNCVKGKVLLFEKYKTRNIL